MGKLLWKGWGASSSSADLATGCVCACFRAFALCFHTSHSLTHLQVANVEKVFSQASEKAKLQIRSDKGSRGGIAGRRASVATGGVAIVASELQIEAEKQGVLTEQVFAVRLKPAKGKPGGLNILAIRHKDKTIPDAVQLKVGSMGITVFAGPPRNQLLESYIYTQVEKYAKNKTELVIGIKAQGKQKGYTLRFETKKIDGEDGFEVDIIQEAITRHATQMAKAIRRQTEGLDKVLCLIPVLYVVLIVLTDLERRSKKLGCSIHFQYGIVR